MCAIVEDVAAIVRACDGSLQKQDIRASSGQLGKKTKTRMSRRKHAELKKNDLFRLPWQRTLER